MPRLSMMFAFILICMALSSQRPATARNLILSDDNKQSKEETPDISEYQGLPEGLLLDGNNQQKNLEYQKNESSINYLANTGYYKIPSVEKEEEESKKALSMDQIIQEYKKGNYTVALNNLKPMAENGQKEAIEILGVMYMTGKGVEKNSPKAFELLQKSAEANMALSQHYLGIMYFQGGASWSPDIISALLWLRLASLHYPNKSMEKSRALSDYNNVYAKATRLERSRAKEEIRTFLTKSNELYLLETE